MNLPDFTSGYWLFLLTLIFFIIITGRYFLIAGLFYFIFYVWFPAKWKERKINKREYKSGQFKKEIKWSLVTSLLFSVAGTITVILWQKGYTKVYTVPNQYGWWYLPVSLLAFMLLQETYYYWIHRWMHIPSVYRIVHKVHHESIIASPFTAFSFHPLEGILQAIYLPALLMILPIHYFVIIILLIIMTFSSVINHLDIEIYPKKSHNIWGNWVIGATHHSLHHKQFKYNFGLYFTFWDKIKKTESPGFKEAMENKQPTYQKMTPKTNDCISKS
jgi:sterol desaturase/sphingolipid hydroxylase (fatty acid hydroxylase superfamily)